jgi:hypothetical protein
MYEDVAKQRQTDADTTMAGDVSFSLVEEPKPKSEASEELGYYS